MPTPKREPGPLPNTGRYQPPLFVDPRLVTNPRGDYLGGPVLPGEAAGATAAGAKGLVDLLSILYPRESGLHPTGPPAVNRWIGGNIRNNRPVADRQTLTMAASQPMLGTGLPAVPAGSVRLYRGENSGNKARGRWFTPDRDFASQYNPEGKVRYVDVPKDVARQYLQGTLKYPPSHVTDIFHPDAGSEFLLPRERSGQARPGASQAIGDRTVTTMTNPLPAYNPLTMVKGQAAAQLRTLINHALAQRGLSPLVNTPLPVGATQMGMSVAGAGGAGAGGGGAGATPPRSQFEGLKPGDRFTYRGPNGTGQGHIAPDGTPRNEKGQELFGHGNPYPVAGLKSEIKAKLAGGGYEYTGRL